MKTTREPLVGALTILLDFDPYRVQGARLSIPLLGIDQHIPQLTQFDTLPAGVYAGTITAFLTTGEETHQNVKIKILPKQGNLHEFKLLTPPREVLVRPVDADNRTILFSEIKIENVDLNFRPVRDESGVVCRIRPGEYQVQIILPNLRIKQVPLRITEDTQVYTLTVPDKHTETRREPRVQLTVPVEYQTGEGAWVSTETINLSSTGICVVKRQWTIDDENLLVRLFLPIRTSPLECAARVRWAKDEGLGSSEMGLELVLDFTTRNSIGKWLSRSVSPRVRLRTGS